MKYLELTIGAVLVYNFVLSRFLGICPFLGVSKRLSTAMGMSGAVIFVMTLAFLSYADIELILLLYGGRRSRASGIPVLFFLVVLFMILFVMILFYGLSIQEYESRQYSISCEEHEVSSAFETNSSSVTFYEKGPVESKENIEFKNPEVPVSQLSENDEGDYQELPAIFAYDGHEEITEESTVPSAANLLVKDVSLLNRIPSKPLILYTFPSLEKFI